jgi:16S rRNA (cytosine967-C5)-methyltransferase
VTAVDSSQSRLARLRDNLKRNGLDADVVRADVLEWQPTAPADAVLVDAPCSATGIFRRHPDVLHRVRPAVVAEMALVQQRILARAAGWVRPGGVLVYATCSLEREEGEDQAEAFLAGDSRFALDPALMPFGTTERGWLRTLPGMLADDGGCDGFFVARFRRAL